MNVIIYYSNTGQSRRIAEYLSKKLEYPTVDIYKLKEYCYQNVVLVFPVYCQNIPEKVKDTLKELEVQFLTVIATYGRMCCGNVIQEVQKQYKHKIIAGAYIPTKHSYLSESEFNDFEKLDIIINKIYTPSVIEIPKSFKNPLSNICIGFRSRVGVKIFRDNTCNNCNLCEKICPNKAMENGKTNHKCIRCSWCVTNCPLGALHFYNRLPLRLYLKKKKTDETIIYI